MKNKFLYLALVSVALASCQKDQDDSSLSDNSNGAKQFIGVPAPPSTFTKKVLMEESSSATVGTCPASNYQLQQLVDNNNGNVIAAVIHYNDAMQRQVAYTVGTRFNGGNTPSIPSAMIDRTTVSNKMFLNTAVWSNVVTNELNKTAPCGLAINSSMTGGKLHITVYGAFKNNMTAPCKLTAYLTEDHINNGGKGYDQVNSDNNNPNSLFYNMGNPITKYAHNFVVQKVITPDGGSSITLSNNLSNSESAYAYMFSQTFTVDLLGSYNINSLKIVAFVHGAGSNQQAEVLNVQEAPVNSFKSWN